MSLISVLTLAAPTVAINQRLSQPGLKSMILKEPLLCLFVSMCGFELEMVWWKCHDSGILLSLYCRMIEFNVKAFFSVLTLLFFVAIVIDFGDLVNFSDQYLHRQFDRVSHVVASVSLMHTQIVLLRAFGLSAATALFYVDVERFIPKLRSINRTSKSISRTVVVHGVILVVLTLTRFFTSSLIAIGMSTFSSSYFLFNTTDKFVLVYSAVILVTGTLMNIFVETSAAYFICFLTGRAEALTAGIQQTRNSLRNSLPWSEDGFLLEVIKIRTAYEEILRDKRQLQRAFGWKLLISVLGDIFEIVVTTAWFVLFAFEPQIGSSRRKLRYALTTSILLLQLWTFGMPLLRIYSVVSIILV